MKISVRLFCIAALALVDCSPAFSWGQKGHDVTCAVAQNHLTPKARRAVSEILDGKSIVYWSNWMDNASHTKEYAYSKTWHYMNFDEGQTFESAPRNDSGDVLSAIESQISALKSGALNKEASALSLKMLVHLVGDLHCPMHMGHKSDLGGNRWQVQYFKTGTNLHSVWDSDLVESAHKWSRSEWVEEIDRCSRKEAAQIAAGTLEDWARETLELAASVYEGTPVGSKLSYDYVAEWTPVIEQELLRGGIRLASILNEIYR